MMGWFIKCPNGLTTNFNLQKWLFCVSSLGMYFNFSTFVIPLDPWELQVFLLLGKIQLKLLCGADLLESFSVPGFWLEEDIHTIVQKHGIVVIERLVIMDIEYTWIS